MKYYWLGIGLFLIAPTLAAFADEIDLQSADGLTSYLYTPQEKPDDHKTYWIVVGVHGAGGNGKGACGIANWATDFDDVVVLGPSFAQRQRDSNRDPSAPRPTGMPLDVFQMSGPVHEAKLNELIAEIGKTWKLHPMIILHGFSAGAQFSHRFAFKHPELVAGVSAHSAGSWARLEGDDRINPAAKSIPFVVSCGEEDKGSGGPNSGLTRIEGVKQFAADLQSLGFSVELKTWPGIGHEQSVESKAFAKTIVEQVKANHASVNK